MSLNFDAIDDLNSWSLNFECGKNPFCLFLDLIGFSGEEYGEPILLNSDSSQFLGYKELCMLGDALKCFEENGYSAIAEHCQSLIDGELEE